MHTFELSGYQTNQRQGWLLRAIPYTDPELLHPEDLIWPPGINNFRVRYTAGYVTVPEDVQEATAELVATFFAQRGPRNDVPSRACRVAPSLKAARAPAAPTAQAHLGAACPRRLTIGFRNGPWSVARPSSSNSDHPMCCDVDPSNRR
jgi:hypothetical protein